MSFLRPTVALPPTAVCPAMTVCSPTMELCPIWIRLSSFRAVANLRGACSCPIDRRQGPNFDIVPKANRPYLRYLDSTVALSAVPSESEPIRSQNRTCVNDASVPDGDVLVKHRMRIDDNSLAQHVHPSPM